MNIPVDGRMVLWFSGTWFATKAFDLIVPPADPVFNAALAIMAALTCYARHREANPCPTP